MLFVLAMAAAPAVWAACGEPPAASAPIAGSDTLAGATETETGSSMSTTANDGPQGTSPAAPTEEPLPPTPTSIASALAAIPQFKRGAQLSVEDCEDLRSKGSDALDVAIEDSSRCTADSDCDSVPYVFCGHPFCYVAIATASRATYEAETALVTRAACPTWQAGGCARRAPVPIPSCARPQPTCKKGRCALF